jgi:hypothetical protein
LTAGGEPADQFIAPVLLHKPIERRPPDEFQNAMEDAVLVAHGVDPFRVRMSRQTL